MARGNCSPVTIPGSSAAIVGRSNACVEPSNAIAAKIPGNPSQPCQTPSATTPSVSASSTWQTSPMRRLSKASATCPTTKVRITIGRN